jgi:hypothetical protein
VIATGGNGYHAGLVHRLEEGLDFIETALQMERALDPGIADVRHPAQVVGRDTARLIHPAHQARLVADLPRPVARPGAIGDTAVEGHAHESDVHAGQILGERRPHESRHTRVTGPQHGLGMAGVVVHSFGSPRGQSMPEIIPAAWRQVLN